MDTQADDANCGDCGVVCEDTEVCSRGGCRPDLAFALRAGGAGNDVVSDIAISATGEAYIVGRLLQEGDWDADGVRREAGAFVAAVRADGSIRWWQTFTTTGGVLRFEAVGFSDLTNSLRVAGRFSGAVTFGTAVLDRPEASLVVLSFDASSGTVDSTFSSSGSGAVTEVHGLAIDMADNVVIGASITGNITLESSVYSTTRQPGALLMSLNTSGDVRWVRTYEVGHLQVASGDAGRVFLLGPIDAPASFGGATLDPAAGDLFIAGLGAGGGHQWSRAVGGASGGFVTYGGSLSSEISGGPVFVAAYRAGTQLDGESLPAHGVVVAALGSDGSTAWTQVYQALSADSGGLALQSAVADGRVYVGGSGLGVLNFGWGATDVGETDASQVGLFFVSHDLSTGAGRWVRTVPRAAGFPTPAGVAANAERIYAVGVFGDAIDFGDGSLITAGLGDIFLTAFED